MSTSTKVNNCILSISIPMKRLLYMGRIKQIWYLSPMRAAMVQASLRISPEPPLLAHTSSESRGTFRRKARSLAPLNGWACSVKICHDGMLEDTNSLDGAHISYTLFQADHWHNNLSVFLTFCPLTKSGHCMPINMRTLENGSVYITGRDLMDREPEYVQFYCIGKMNFRCFTWCFTAHLKILHSCCTISN